MHNRDGDHGPTLPWTLLLARGECRGWVETLEMSLMDKQLMTHYCEWCSTPRPDVCGIVYEDVAFLYDLDDRPPLRMTQSPADRKHIDVGTLC